MWVIFSFALFNLFCLNMIEIICNDRLGKKVAVKSLPEDTIGEFKQVLALQMGISADKIVLKRGYVIFKNHISLQDYEINDGNSIELYYA